MNRGGVAIAALMACSFAGAARAESLFDVIRLADQANPTLRAKRAELRATDETYVQARAGYGPQVNATGQVGYQDAVIDSTRGLGSKATDNRAGTGSTDLSLVQPIYTSGAAKAQIQAAAAQVLAARQDLRQTENQLIQTVITAYVDVRRDREPLRILKDEIENLNRAFAETQARGKLGQLTRTDVAESEARLLSAQAQLNLAVGHLNASNAAYLSAVGQAPGDLEPEPELPGLPTTVNEAFDSADANNPQLLSSIQAERAAREKVNQAKAANGPTVSIRIDAQIEPVEPYLERQYDRNVTVAATYTQPLFTSGMNSSRIRQALEQDNQAQMAVEAARRGIVQLVAQAWAQLVSTRKAMVIEARQVEVEQVAVEGNRIEERVGFRRTIDLLNAELELAQSRLSLLQSRHDEYVARAALLGAMGVLEVRFLTPGGERYRPEASLRRVAKIGAVPWEGAVGLIDGLGGPNSPPPRRSATNSGAERPADLPPLPDLPK